MKFYLSKVNLGILRIYLSKKLKFNYLFECKKIEEFVKTKVEKFKGYLIIYP